MSEAVWMSRAPADASNLRRLRHTFSDSERRQAAIEWGRDNVDGLPLGPECFPDEIFGARNAEEADYRLPDLFFAGSYWVISKSAADIIGLFDLGSGALYPVRVLRADRETPVGGEWFCINFGNRKKAFLPSESPTARQRYIRDGEKGWFAKATIKDDDFVVSREALVGPDIWIDPQVGDAFFLSDRLSQALRTSGADDGFFLTKCRVVGA